MSDVDPDAGDAFPLGALVVDRELAVEKQDPMVVVNRPPVTAAEWDVEADTTVADTNPGYAADTEVIITVHLQSIVGWYPELPWLQDVGSPIPITELNTHNVLFYAFPAPRLRQIGRTPSHSLDDLKRKALTEAGETAS